MKAFSCDAVLDLASITSIDDEGMPRHRMVLRLRTLCSPLIASAFGAHLDQVRLLARDEHILGATAIRPWSDACDLEMTAIDGHEHALNNAVMLTAKVKGADIVMTFDAHWRDDDVLFVANHAGQQLTLRVLPRQLTLAGAA